MRNVNELTSSSFENRIFNFYYHFVFRMKMRAICLGYNVHPTLHIALLMFFSIIPVFCLSLPYRTDESYIISPFFFFACLPACLSFSPILGCHFVIPFVHLLSFRRATYPDHLHFDCFILTTISVTPDCFLMSEHLSQCDIFSTCHPLLFGLIEVCFPNYLVLDHVSDPYVIVGRTHWL